MRRLVLYFVIVLLLAALAAGYYAVRLVRPWPAPEPVERAENALAVPGLVGLAYLNVEQAVALERLARAKPDEGTLPDVVEEGQHPDLVSSLQARGVDPRAVIHHWVIGAIPVDSGPGLVQILLGDFPVELLQSILEETYDVESASKGEAPLFTLTRVDIETCERSEPILVSLERKRVVFGEPQLVAQVLERLRSDATPETNLAAWREFRSAHVASVGLVMPRELDRIVSNPILKMMLAGALEKATPLEAAFLGALPRLLPPAVTVDTSLEARDPGWAREQEQRFTAWRLEMEAKTSEKLPSAARLLRRISAQVAGSKLQFQVTLNPKLRQEIENLLGEGGRLVFGGSGDEALGALSNPMAGEPQEVTIEARELQKYPSPFGADQIPEFARDESQTIEGEIQVGPFGVRHRAARILRDQGGIVELELAAESSRIPNLGSEVSFTGETPRLRLFVSRAPGRNGQDLLREERCGRERNSLGKPLRAISDIEFVHGSWVKVAPQYSGSKTVRLREGAQLEDIASVEGYIDLRLPTKIETRRVDAPLADKVIDGDGIRIKFGASEGGQLAYEVSGRKDKLLAIRGRNASGQALKSGGASSMGSLFGSGERVSRNFMGEIAGAEVILVEEESSTHYPFVLEDLGPRFRSWSTSESNVVVAQQPRAFRKEISSSDPRADCQMGVDAGASVQPFHLCLESGQMFWGGQVNSSFELLSPYSHSIAGNLSALELVVDAIWVAASDAKTTEPLRVPARGQHFAWLKRDRDKLQLEDRLWFDFETEEEPPNQHLTHIDGRLIHRLPTEIFPLRLDITKLGNEIDYSNGFAMKLIEIGENGMRIWMQGDRNRIVQFVVRDEQNQVMITTSDPIEPASGRGSGLGALAGGDAGQTDGWIGSFQISTLEAGAPTTLEVIYALAMEETAYAFHVAVPQ